MKFKIGQMVEMEDGSRGKVEEILITSEGTYYGIMKSWGLDDLAKEDTIKAVCEQCKKTITAHSSTYCCLQCRHDAEREAAI